MTEALRVPVWYVEFFTTAGATYTENLSLTALALVALTDIQRYKDLGGAVPLVVLVTESDYQHFQDLGLAVSLVGIVSGADVQHYREVGAISAQAQAALSELQHYKEALALTAVGVVSLATEVYHGSNPTENLAFTAVGAASVMDLQHYLEASLPVAAQGVLNAADAQHYIDALQILIAATLTATELAHWHEQLQALASGQVALNEAQHYREIGLLVHAVATVTGTDVFRLARPGLPIISFLATPQSRSFILQPLTRTFEASP